MTLRYSKHIGLFLEAGFDVIEIVLLNKSVEETINEEVKHGGCGASADIRWGMGDGASK